MPQLRPEDYPQKECDHYLLLVDYAPPSMNPPYKYVCVKCGLGYTSNSMYTNIDVLKTNKLVSERKPNMPVEGQKVTNENGGSQSFIEADFQCVPPKPLRLLAQCLGFGRRKYGFENWKNIPLEDNLSHAMNHINEWRAGDRSEPHLVNAMARITFALSQVIDSKEHPERYIHPDMLKDTK